MKYVSEIYTGKAARRQYLSGPHDSHEVAARDAFAARPNAKKCSTCRAHLIGSHWLPAHTDIRHWQRTDFEHVCDKGSLFAKALKPVDVV